MADLITVPHFQFQQGDDPIVKPEEWQYPIDVKYYEDGVLFEQEGRGIYLSYTYLNEFFREVRRHIPEARAKWQEKEGGNEK